MSEKHENKPSLRRFPIQAERDALKRRVDHLENSHAAHVARASAEEVTPHAYPELVRVLAGNGVDLARLAEALPGFAALKRRVAELQRLVDNATAGPGDHI